MHQNASHGADSVYAESQTVFIRQQMTSTSTVSSRIVIVVGNYQPFKRLDHIYMLSHFRPEMYVCIYAHMHAREQPHASLHGAFVSFENLRHVP